jgi:hypothetical protein
MRIFLFINLIFIVSLTGPVHSHALRDGTIMAPDTIRNWDPVFGNDFRKGLYKATLDISRHHLAGFIFIKKVSDTSYRILFSNEFGMQIFDFEFLENEFIVHYCFPSMDRKSLLEIMETDFRILLFSNIGVKKITQVESDYKEDLTYKIKSNTGKWTFRISGASRKVISIRSVGRFISKTRIELGQSGDSIGKINISNPLIKLRINLSPISR